VLSGTNPDLIEMKAPDTSKSGSIGVDEVRELTRELSEKPFGGGGRAVLVQGAHRMTPAAQNALLKTLEEPGAGTVFLLLAEQEEAMLPTIRSRCRLVRLGRLSLEEMRRGLLARGVPEAEAEALYDRSDGILGRALEIRGNEEVQKMEAFCASLLGGGGEKAMIARLYEAAKFEKPEQALFFDRLEALLRQELTRAERQGESYASPGFTSLALHSMMKEMLLAKKRLSSNVSFASAIEPLFWRLFGG
jgi:replication-associated recombination protein RarA